ncbi:hypothetical protein V5O48_016961 [Marasmius crinis-equi]|uniref:Uncharacterized protein n=1 Tax=Marasmius crinis-equi TaxID=585013 RepID=A0ABR3EQB7_9AGAR
MSVNPSELSLGDNHTNGSTFTNGPFPILSCGTKVDFNPPHSSNEVRLLGGENPGGNPFGTPFNFLHTPAAASSSGVWLANLKLAVISHKHSDRSPCFNVLEHAVQADSEEDPSFTAAYNKLIDHFITPEKTRNTELKKQLQSVTEERDRILQQVQSTPKSSTRSISGMKRKSDHEPASSHHKPPAPRASRAITNSPPIPSPPSYSSSFETLLVANPRPLWAAFTRFTRYESTVRPSDSIANWLEGESPLKVPSVRTPGNCSTDEQYALFVWLHYDSRGHMGIILTDSGLIALNSVMAHRVLHKMAPKEQRETFRRESLRLITWPGLYSQLLQELGLEVNPAGQVRRCPPNLSGSVAGVAEHFAHCGISVNIVDKMFHYGAQFCIDVQSSPFHNPEQRNIFAQIYKFGRIRSLFFPIRSIHSDRIYRVSDHIDYAQVLEYVTSCTFSQEWLSRQNGYQAI